MINKIQVKVKAFYMDGGDDGGGFSLYNDKEHYIKEESKYSSPEEAEERWDKAESSYDPYEDGKISDVTIELENDRGNWKLTKSCYLHWGQ